MSAFGRYVRGQLSDEIGHREELEALAEVRVVLMLTLHLLCRGGAEESHLSV